MNGSIPLEVRPLYTDTEAFASQLHNFTSLHNFTTSQLHNFTTFEKNKTLWAHTSSSGLPGITCRVLDFALVLEKNR